MSQDIISVTRTVYGTALAAIQQLGLSYTLTPNTTLNEKFGIQAGVAPSAGQIPTTHYLAIGNLGHTTVKAADGSDETIPVPHRATDAGLYNQIPFAIRPLDNDLPANERGRYALRSVEQVNGVACYVYRLLRLDFDGVDIEYQYSTVTDGQVSWTTFVPTSDNLNPPRPNITGSGVVLGTSESVSATALVTIKLDSFIINEIINAHQMRTGSTRSPVISELAFCSGVDRVVVGQSGTSGSVSYNEAIAVQVAVHVSTYQPIGYSTTGSTLVFDLGGTEPMIAESLGAAPTWN